MSIDQIPSALEQCRTNRVTEFDLPSPVAERDDIEILRRTKGPDAAEAAEHLIRNVEECLHGDSSLTVHVAGYMRIIHSQNLAHWLIARCNEGAPVTQAVTKFDKFLHIRKVPGSLITVLGNAEVSDAVSFSNGVSMVPSKAIRDELQRYGGLLNPLQSFPIAGITAPVLTKGIKLPIRRLFRDGNWNKFSRGFDDPECAANRTYLAEKQAISEIVRVLTVCGSPRS